MLPHQKGRKLKNTTLESAIIGFPSFSSRKYKKKRKKINLMSLSKRRVKFNFREETFLHKL